MIKENGVLETRLEEKQEVERLEMEELIKFGEEERVRREVALGGKQVQLGGDKEVKDYYLQDCQEEDQWCKIVPYLLNIEAETAELGEGGKVRHTAQQATFSPFQISTYCTCERVMNVHNLHPFFPI